LMMAKKWGNQREKEREKNGVGAIGQEKKERSGKELIFIDIYI
jgi:hypothetical protein